MATFQFREMLARRQEEIRSVVCVGLDPLVEKLPEIIRASCQSVWTGVLYWMRAIVDATVPYALTFKPQRAHWEAIPQGVDALQALMAHIRIAHPKIPIVLDCKRGDIDRTQKQYAEAHFMLDGVHGMNYNGYMGKDTLKSLVDLAHPGRALVGLGRTSNREAWEIQDQVLLGGRRLWEFMVERLLAWSTELGVLENAGVVMGAAYPEDPKDPESAIYSQHLLRAREIVGDKMWFLIPGCGKQGGAERETILAAYRGPGSIAVNSSSDIDFASAGPDFAEAAARKAEAFRDRLNAALRA